MKLIRGIYKLLVVTTIVLLCANLGYAQNSVVDSSAKSLIREFDQENDVFVVVEDPPEFPGGDKALKKFLGNNINYPAYARETGMQGTVYLTMIIETDGSISNIQVLKSVGGGCDEEAIRVVKLMPKWKPGKQRGNPVRVQYILPVKYTMAN